MTEKTILIVEDDKRLANQIASFLEGWKYKPILASQFDVLDQEVFKISPDLVLMDITLPYFDGYYWTRQIRKKSTVPILFISSRTADQDIIMAIVQGGDDYLTKPFSLDLLKAKMDALFRRTDYRIRPDTIELNETLYYVPDKAQISDGKQIVELTGMEKKVMDLFVKKKSITISREELMIALWQTDEFICDGSLTTCISRLRSKLKAAFHDPLIETKKGIGYQLP